MGGLIFVGGVPELADGPDLGSGAAMRGGSSPPFPTTRNSSRTSIVSGTCWKAAGESLTAWNFLLASFVSTKLPPLPQLV